MLVKVILQAQKVDEQVEHIKLTPSTKLQFTNHMNRKLSLNDRI